MLTIGKIINGPSRIKVATPISSLFRQEANAQAIIARSDCLECRDHSPGSGWPRQELFHSELQPIHPLSGVDWDRLQAIKATKPELRVVSMHLASCCDRPTVVRGRFEPGGVARGRSELLTAARKNFARMRTIFGSSVTLAVENNNYYSTGAYDWVCDGDFISEIVRSNGLKFLFDVAHAHITSANRGMDYRAYLASLPMEAIIQVHVCRYGTKESGEAYDAHELPGNAEFEELGELLLDCEVEYVTFEYYKEAAGLIACLERLVQLGNGIAGRII